MVNPGLGQRLIPWQADLEGQAWGNDRVWISRGLLQEAGNRSSLDLDGHR